MKYFIIYLVLFTTLIFNACSSNSKNPTSSVPNGESGSANITVKIGNVGSLAKSATIEFAKLCVSLSASGEAPIYDTIPISGNGTNTVSKTYGPLASLKTWTLIVHSLDTRDSIIHSGSTTFNVLPRQTVTIPVLDLSAHFSMLKANFFPIRDSVTRCELLVNGINVDDSSFVKQILLGDTVKLDYDYLKTNVSQRIKMDVYGSMWGFDTLLYTGDTAITPLPGVNSTYAITLRWVGPALPPPGQATMTVILGAVGTVTVEGELEDTTRISLFGTNGKAWYEKKTRTIKIDCSAGEIWIDLDGDHTTYAYARMGGWALDWGKMGDAGIGSCSGHCWNPFLFYGELRIGTSTVHARNAAGINGEWYYLFLEKNTPPSDFTISIKASDGTTPLDVTTGFWYKTETTEWSYFNL